VSALLRRVSAAGSFAAIVHRGDPDRGDVLVKVRSLEGRSSVYAPAFNPGEACFETLCLDEAEVEADALIARRLGRDRDLWVIEIEDRDGRHFLTERIVTGA
jgi:hypothetical protein